MMSFREPRPRWRHAAVGIGRRLHVWGGTSATMIPSKTVHSFDVPSLTWEEPRKFRGSLPGSLYDMAVATDGENAHTFGGWNDSYSNTIYRMNPEECTLRELLPADSGSPCAPEAKSYSSMVQFKGKLVVHGGYGDEGRTDELHVFDLKKSKCGNNSSLDYNSKRKG